MGRRSKYPEEFRRNAAKLALEGGRSVREVARELGVNHEPCGIGSRCCAGSAVTGRPRSAGRNAPSWPGCAGGWRSWSWRKRCLYLAVVIDACTRRVVGWAMADHLHHELVLDALGMALHQRKPVAGLIHHSDHGVQYTSIEFGRTLRTSSVVAAMGSIGDAFDNAMAESFFATLKEEMIYRRAWPTRHELEIEVFSFIEGFYNPLRRHSRLGNLSPAAYEQQITTQTEVSG
jgi:transposase InsO family protein